MIRDNINPIFVAEYKVQFVEVPRSSLKLRDSSLTHNATHIGCV